MVHSILKLEYNVINFEYNRGRGTSWKLFQKSLRMWGME
nr:MAG TPA: hypothetical protein [Caudoviricetes sp.]DAJ17233.1 MAG TPA: hypothetical protein [Siphoviridae sp. ctza41]